MHRGARRFTFYRAGFQKQIEATRAFRGSKMCLDSTFKEKNGNNGKR